jgi:Mg-chelatase subunit ChlD
MKRPAGVLAVEVHDLSLLASALAGRRTALQVARDDDGLRHAYFDGQRIMLPAAVAGSEQGWLHVVSQALLIGAGSLDPTVLRRLVARPAAARRYAWLEVVRAGVLLSDRVPPRYARALKQARAPLTHDPVESATLALSDQALPDMPDFIGTVRPLAVLRGAVSRDGMAALKSRAAIEKIQPPEPMREFGEDEASEDSKILRLFSNPFSGRNPVSDMLNQILGVGASRGHRQDTTEGNDGSELPIGRIERAWRRGANALRAQLPLDVHEPDPQHEPATHVYPEWDGATQRYRPDWVCVDEVDPWRPDGPRDLAATLQVPSLRLRRELSRLPLDFEMHRRQRDGTEFDVGALIDHAASLRTGHAIDTPAVYRASHRTRRDLGVVVVMDASGSTEERNERGESVFDHHAGAALRITRTLDALGDRVALYGFQSWGRRLVHMVRLKGQEEAWSGRVAERLAHLDAVGFTRTGAAVRHVDRLLRTQIRLPHRLLVLITDGLSYDSDYEGAYAEDDTRKALAEARAQGTACVCICIGGSVEAATLARVFGASQLLMVDDSSQIDARLRGVCARALAGVSRRGRSAARAAAHERMAA